MQHTTIMLLFVLFFCVRNNIQVRNSKWEIHWTVFKQLKHVCRENSKLVVTELGSALIHGLQETPKGVLWQTAGAKIVFYLEFITCHPLIYTVDHPKVIVSNQIEESISA